MEVGVKPRSISVHSFISHYGALAIAGLMTLSVWVCAQENGSPLLQPAWGTSDSPTANRVKPPTPALIVVDPRVVYQNAAIGSGGVGLRNWGTGAISISGVVNPAKAAYLYWAVITDGVPGAAETRMKLQRLSPIPVSSVATINGTLVGTGDTPCWTGDRISVYRGQVPVSVANGNGLYQVSLFAGAGGLTNRRDPWDGTPVLPLMEGASLVVVGKGQTGEQVAFYDDKVGGITFTGAAGLSYILRLPSTADGATVLLDSIGADGQEGTARTDTVGYSDETTTINGVLVAGPGSNASDSDWNGSSSKPLPQLWDDVGHDITAAAPSGTTLLNVGIRNAAESPSDCMTTVANIVSENLQD